MAKAKSDATPLYEGMFVINPQALGGELSAGLQRIQQILEKRDAEVVSLRKWDDRKLAYPIQGQKRGTYFLALFRVSGQQIATIERDCELSEEVMRVLVTRADHYGQTEIEQEQEAAKTTTTETKLRGEGEAAAPAESAEPAATTAAAEPAEGDAEAAGPETPTS